MSRRDFQNGLMCRSGHAAWTARAQARRHAEADDLIKALSIGRCSRFNGRRWRSRRCRRPRRVGWLG
jgi:hypothetical protein